jgi:ABC-type Fe3+/spermidine/putrescine transport system ATPase subunit
VPGRVSERAGAELVVDTAVGRLRAVPSGPVGDRCVLAIRPENVTIGAVGTTDAGNVVSGRVSFVAYLGSALRYDIEAGQGQLLKADIRDPWHHEPLPIGREVIVSFPASVTLAVAPDAPEDA